MGLRNSIASSKLLPLLLVLVEAYYKQLALMAYFVALGLRNASRAQRLSVMVNSTRMTFLMLRTS